MSQISFGHFFPHRLILLTVIIKTDQLVLLLMAYLRGDAQCTWIDKSYVTNHIIIKDFFEMICK